MNTRNVFVVSERKAPLQAKEILILKPPAGPMSKDEALLLAAWLVVTADPYGSKFEDVLKQVRAGSGA